MREVLSVPGLVRPREVRELIPTRHYNITFEPGNHPDFQDEYEKVRDRFAAGDLDAHFWNPEVGRRLGFYQPRILTLDGEYILPSEPGLELSYNGVQESLWRGLPTQPRLINPSGSIFSVSADQIVPNAIRYAFTTATRTVDDPLGEAIAAEIQKESAVHFEDESSTPITSTMKTAGILGLPVGMLTGLIFSARALRAEGPVSRRRFLIAKGGGAVAGLSVASIGGGFLFEDDEYEGSEEGAERRATFAATAQERADTVAAYDATAKQVQSPWVAARNALYSFKTRSAYEQLGIDPSVPSAVIAGSDHMTGMTRSLQDEQYAAESLRTYVRTLFSVIDRFYAEGRSHPLTPDQSKRLLVDMIALTGIDEVRQPDEAAFRADPKAAVKDIVTRKAYYKDQRTLQALAPLLG